jgi:hypothetical protein
MVLRREPAAETVQRIAADATRLLSRYGRT